MQLAKNIVQTALIIEFTNESVLLLLHQRAIICQSLQSPKSMLLAIPLSFLTTRYNAVLICTLLLFFSSRIDIHNY